MIHNANFSTPCRVTLYFLTKPGDDPLTQGQMFEDYEEAWEFAYCEDLETYELHEFRAYVDPEVVKVWK